MVLHESFQIHLMHAQMIDLAVTSIWVPETSRVEAAHRFLVGVHVARTINDREHLHHDGAHLALLAFIVSLCQCAASGWIEPLTLEPTMDHLRIHSDDAHLIAARRGSATGR